MLEDLDRVETRTRSESEREFDDDEEGIDPKLLKAAQILDEERKRSR